LSKYCTWGKSHEKLCIIGILELFYIVGFSNVRDRRGVNGEEKWPQYRALGYTNGTRYGAGTLGT